MNGMERLAIRRGLVYEGAPTFLHAIHPTPLLTAAKIEGAENHGGGSSCAGLIFREDSFDPVTRIRRGRMYKFRSDTYQNYPPANISNYPFGPHVGVAGEWTPDCEYEPYQPNITSPDYFNGIQIILGGGELQTSWRIVGTERISTGEVLFTLRSLSTMGALPLLNSESCTIDGDLVDVSVIRRAMDKLIDAFHVQQAVSIVDVARETTRIILAAWVGRGAEGKDLNDVIAKIPTDRDVVNWASNIIKILHPRGKSAEQEKRAAKDTPIRLVVDEDAETSIHLVGLIIREIGWATA
ncbi:MAG: hypothetical protein ACYDCW_09550 [Acidithiobacillus ferrivorans]